MIPGVGRLVALATFAALFGFSASGEAAAQAPELFSPVTPADSDVAAQAAAPASRAAVRERLVTVNGTALAAASPAPDGRAAAGGVRIVLFPGSAATFAAVGVEPGSDGRSVWRGSAGEDGAATLVIDGGTLTGRITLDGRVYRIAPVAGRVHRVSELSREKLPPNGPSAPPPGAGTKSPDAAEAPPAEPAGETVVTALFAYTRRSDQAPGNINADIDLAVALTNDGYRASRVRIRMRLVGSIAVRGYDENDFSYGRVLDDLTFPDAPGAAAFDATRRRRNALGADLVVLLREGGDFCGLAWVNAPPTRQGSADFGYSENTRDCISFDVVAHETGHNMGLNHDRYVSAPAPNSAYNFGYVNVRKRVRDIMSYENRCFDAGVSCRQQNAFSNPDIRVKTQPFGIEQGEPGAADAARWLNQYRGAVAGFRPDRDGAEVARDLVGAAAE